MASYSLFKTKHEMGDLQQTFEAINKKFGEKYKVTLNKASSGAMKFVTGNTTDYISIKKNAYHGAIISVSQEDSRVDYRTISFSSYTPNTLVNQVLGKTGIVDILIAKLIWGNGTPFYDEIENFIQTEFEGTGVDMSLKNTAKQMLKGKSVLDD